MVPSFIWAVCNPTVHFVLCSEHLHPDVWETLFSQGTCRRSSPVIIIFLDRLITSAERSEAVLVSSLYTACFGGRNIAFFSFVFGVSTVTVPSSSNATI